jgi:hypothetical protein
MNEVNRNAAGLAQHKYQIGDCHVWADSLQQAEKIYREHQCGILHRCDPKVIAQAYRTAILKVQVPPIKELY